MRAGIGIVLGFLLAFFASTCIAQTQQLPFEPTPQPEISASLSSSSALPGHASPAGYSSSIGAITLHGSVVHPPSSPRIADSKYFLLNGLHLSMAIFDVEMTQRCIASHHCREDNPMMPSSNAGQLSVNFAIVAYGAGMSYWAKKHKSHFWWIAPSAGIAVHSIGVTTGFEHQ